MYLGISPILPARPTLPGQSTPGPTPPVGNFIELEPNLFLIELEANNDVVELE